MRIKGLISAMLAMSMAIFGSCAKDNPSSTPEWKEPTPGIGETEFAKGADVSWLTQLESEGYKFKNTSNQEKECMKLLKEDCGVNAIRLRVWVNPKDKWNNIEDVAAKAKRASDLGLKIMIDFHFSDTWADPGHQETPAAWANCNMEELKLAVKGHVWAMLNRLKELDVTPQWVQIGNETRGGMLYPLGKSENEENYTDLVNVAYDAIKEICPDAQTIIHIDRGDWLDLYTYIFDLLKRHSGKFDMIGMSLYPEANNWKTVADACISNINTLFVKYGKPVMICEVGMDYNNASECRDFIQTLMEKGKADGHLKGIFYWEPEAPAGYNGGYNKGCFKNGMPTVALDAFKTE